VGPKNHVIGEGLDPKEMDNFRVVSLPECIVM